MSVNELVHCPLCASTLKISAIGGKDRLACIVCEFVHWNNPKPVTATLVTMGEKLVLVKRRFEPFIGDWCLPGGFIEDSEHPEESAIREVQEEAGINVEITKLVGATAPGRNINVVILFYLARLIKDEYCMRMHLGTGTIPDRSTTPQFARTFWESAVTKNRYPHHDPSHLRLVGAIHELGIPRALFVQSGQTGKACQGKCI